MPTRSITPDDYPFIAQLARAETSFTVPTPYVLWLVLQLGGVNLMVTDADQRPVAYVLSAPMGGDSLFIWQLHRSATPDIPNATDQIIAAVKAYAKDRSLSRILFTLRDRRGLRRWVERVAARSFGSSLIRRTPLPPTVAVDEALYEISLPRTSP